MRWGEDVLGQCGGCGCTSTRCQRSLSCGTAVFIGAVLLPSLCYIKAFSHKGTEPKQRENEVHIKRPGIQHARKETSSRVLESGTDLFIHPFACL